MIQQQPLLGMYTKAPYPSQRHCTSMFIAALFTITKEWNQQECPLNSRVDHENVVHIYTMELYSTPKKRQTTECARKWMELEIIILREAAQTQKDNHHIFFLKYGSQLRVCICLYINGCKWVRAKT